MRDPLSGPDRFRLKAAAARWRMARPPADAAELAGAIAALMDERDHLAEQVAQLRTLLRDMTDPDPCSFDHHGGCQAHGYLSLKPGEKCPHAEAKELLALGGTEAGS